jgi:Flp pilus assembly protein TadD
VIGREPSNEVARQGLAQAGSVYFDLAARQIEQGRPDEAERLARTLLRIDSRSAEAHNLLGVALGSQGRISDAIAEFRSAVELDPNNQRARNNLTHVLSLGAPPPRR